MKDFDAEIDAAADDLLALCSDLVAADSINPPGRTSEVALIVARWLEARGVDARIMRSDDEAPNVLAQVRGAAPGSHVVFNAHMDTMPAGDISLWTVPPLALTRRDGKAYGLGMGNMKGALASMCLVTALLQRRAGELSGRLSLTAVSDEVMFGERGTIFLLRERPDLAGDYVISGEGPGYMDLAVAEKGLLWLDLVVTAPGGHSSNARTGETAPIILAKFLAEIDTLNDRFAAVPDDLPGVSGGEGNLGFRLSVNVGALDAGGVRSQLANEASAQLDFRLPPGLSCDAVEQAVRGFIPATAQIEISRVKGWDANWTDVAHPLVAAVLRAAREVRGDTPRQVVRLPGSDARQWRDLGVPAICYGPQPTLSAGIDDHALEKDLLDCAKVYARAALEMMARN